MGFLEVFDKLFVNRKDVPVVPPRNFIMDGPETDAPEFFDDSRRLMDIDGLALAIEYRDPVGALSKRVISCRSVNPRPPGFLRAYCHLRDEYRTFQLDRIRSITDMETEELIDKRGVVEFLAPYIDFSIKQEKVRAQRRLQYRAGPGVKVLVFLAAADGHIHSRERQLIVDYAITEAMREAPDSSFDAEATVRWINHVKPTRFAARSAALKLAEDVDRFRQFSQTMISVVQADGRVDEAEAEAVRDIIAAVRSERSG